MLLLHLLVVRKLLFLLLDVLPPLNLLFSLHLLLVLKLHALLLDPLNLLLDLLLLVLGDHCLESLSLVERLLRVVHEGVLVVGVAALPKAALRVHELIVLSPNPDSSLVSVIGKLTLKVLRNQRPVLAYLTLVEHSVETSSGTASVSMPLSEVLLLGEILILAHDVGSILRQVAALMDGGLVLESVDASLSATHRIIEHIPMSKSVLRVWRVQRQVACI